MLATAIRYVLALIRYRTWQQWQELKVVLFFLITVVCGVPIDIDDK